MPGPLRDRFLAPGQGPAAARSGGVARGRHRQCHWRGRERKRRWTGAGYTAGPLFRASINGRGRPLSYDAAHHRWQSYCAQAGVEIDIHQLRHAHATELINAGVSIEAVRRRLGHASTETTQLYALLDDKVADAEIRAARRRRDRATR
ncbi:site-specific integrase [Nonomuraea fuscirosea]|uniref:tyrosine-type recombinase/integrase n=1 Tax=Nonomuraea fuscirosea TaxID=1291556 RepID=UPI002DDB9053|nr:site-specific integrase [Nonomuraea fuscirosea]WSA58359.1 site-specific integrase [Nonomuraea fuscirosea]